MEVYGHEGGIMGLQVSFVYHVFMVPLFGSYTSREHHVRTHVIPFVPLSVPLFFFITYPEAHLHIISFTLIYRSPLNVAVEVKSYACDARQA